MAYRLCVVFAGSKGFDKQTILTKIQQLNLALGHKD